MFFKKSSPISLHKLVQIIDANTDAPDMLIENVGPLDKLTKTMLGCYHNSKYKDSLKNLKEGICLITKEDSVLLPSTVIPVYSPTPYRSFGKAVSYFYPKESTTGIVSPLAQVHPTAILGSNCQIDAFVVIGENVKIGANSIIRSHCFIGHHVELGENCVLESGVTITNTIAGDCLYVKSGARIGQQGFGFHMDAQGHFDIPQIGCVRIGHDVQIGANTTIDRGSQHDTIIGNFCRIDNLVQLAHNVELGDGCVIVAQVGIAGSTKLGKFVIAAGQVGIAGHLNVGDGVKIAAQSGLMRDVEKGQTIAGSPAVPVRDWHRQTVALQKLIKQ